MAMPIGVPIKGKNAVFYCVNREANSYAHKNCYDHFPLIIFLCAVLHEAEGHVVTVESTTGEVYRGKLIEAEDNMNLQVGYLHLITVHEVDV